MTLNLAQLLCGSCALFLDFDGTLVDIAEQPEAVVVPQDLVPTLEQLAGFLGGAVAVISGRPIAQIEHFLAPLKLPVAGVHGAERRTADGELVLAKTHPLDAVEAAARSLADQDDRLKVEVKRGSIALHYRLAPEREEQCLHAMMRAVAASPGLTLLRGKMVVEAKPGGASKGHAIEEFLREPPFRGRTPLFVGDDVTDEVGFSTVQRLGGMGVKVGEGPTVAWQRIATPELFRRQMRDLVRENSGKAAA
jgi:trehalose 6-phosphate phosphatase